MHCRYLITQLTKYAAADTTNVFSHQKVNKKAVNVPHRSQYNVNPQ